MKRLRRSPAELLLDQTVVRIATADTHRFVNGTFDQTFARDVGDDVDELIDRPEERGAGERTVPSTHSSMVRNDRV
jgi:hypothetical protein